MSRMIVFRDTSIRCDSVVQFTKAPRFNSSWMRIMRSSGGRDNCGREGMPGTLSPAPVTGKRPPRQPPLPFARTYSTDRRTHNGFAGSAWS